METKIINNVPNINVTIDKSKDNQIIISITEKNNKVPIGSVKPGSIVKIGKYEFIILGHNNGVTDIIAKDFTKYLCFGDTGSYIKSNVRKYCNSEFLNELAAAIDMDNIVEHTVNLMAEDGTGKGKTCKDKVSIITTENYRRYREFLSDYGYWWWTANRPSYHESYGRFVCYVGANGILNFDGCDDCGGVRPFCTLKSSTLINYLEKE